MNSNFDFDLGLGSNQPKSLNAQKNKPSSSSSSFSSTTTTQPRPAWQPKTTNSIRSTSWMHQPAQTRPGFTDGPTSMVGDIFGKSWGSTAPPAVSATPIAVVNKNPNLFGDLVSSALGGGKLNSNSNAPLKNATPVVASASNNKSSFSMGNVADSLPKTAPASSNISVKGANYGASGNLGSFSTGFNTNNTNTYKINSSINASSNKSTSLGGGPSLRNMGSASVGVGLSSKKDPFGSLVDLASKPSATINSANKTNSSSSFSDDAFGDFQNAPKPSTTATTTFASNDNSFMGSNTGSGFGDFGMPAKSSSPVQSTSSDPFDSLFVPSSGSAGGVAAENNGVGVQQSSDIDDWGTEFGGGHHDGGGSTTELEGLPPPPAGVSPSAAKNKGMDNYKQGQYPDAIKWLSWAVILLEKGSDRAAVAEVLSSRASCYKEVGEYKKAVADCTKVLEQDDANVSVLVQRALLYESMEKYRLGAEDLRTVLKFDPGNRVARSTIHRLTKLAD